jgi:RNA polymerase sigma factor (sigma-70 family)
MIRQVERERLFDVTREAALEAVFRYPTKPPARFFLWLRETIAHRALDALRAELPEVDIAQERPAEAEAVHRALAGLDQLEGPQMRDRAGMRAWRRRIRMRDVFDVVEQFFEHDGVRAACQQAVGRLPHAERRVINGYFFEELGIAAIAARSNITHSTVYNQKAKAQRGFMKTTSSSRRCTPSGQCETKRAHARPPHAIRTGICPTVDASS